MIYKLLRYTITLLMTPMVSGMLVSCINDDFVDACPSESEGKTLYLSINVKSDSDITLTRAGNVPDADGMLDGDWPEHLTTDHIAIFFNENEKKDGPGSLYAITTLGLPATHEDFKDDNPNKKEANYIAVFRVTKEDKEKYEKDPSLLPKYCLVVLNGGKIKKHLEEECKNCEGEDAIDKILKLTWNKNLTDPENIGYNDKDYFTMTNSVYVKDGKVHAAQEISPLKFKNTPDDAKGNPVTIYVERIVAKFTFGIDITRSAADSNFNIIYPKNSDGQNAAPLVFFDQLEKDSTLYKAWPWIVNITGWGINAQEKNSYIFKNIDPDKAYFGNDLDWNDDKHFRSYWSEDPHYDYKYDESGNKTEWTYPWQYRNALDNKDLDNYEQKEDGNQDKENILMNYSYNKFIKNNIGKELYTPENTYDPSLYTKGSKAYLDDRTSVLAGTHLLVCAEVQISRDGGNTYFTPEHLYRDRQGIYYESEEQLFRMFVHSINSLLKSQRTMDFTLYNWKDGGLINDIQYTDDKEEIKIAKADEFTAKAMNQNETEIYQLYYYDTKKELTDGKDEYVELTDANIDKLIEKKLIKMSSAIIEHGDGRVLPWLADDKLVICAKDGEKYTQLRIWTRDKIKDLNELPGQFGFEIEPGVDVTKGVLEKNHYDNCIKSLLYEWFGPVDHFNGGKMYYAAPISHRKSSDADGSEDKNTEESLGDYGVVRNCWYKFTLTGINRIGTPVDNPDEPIVPGLIDIKDVINTKVDFQIIPWHEEETLAPLY